MRILAIDTALPAVAACVMEKGVAEPLAEESEAMARGHAEAIMPLIERVVLSTRGGFAGLDRVAVTNGPGSFTGIRIGLAAARAIALARGIPAVGVSTLQAFAAPLILAHADTPILVCIDARHGRVYAQEFSAKGSPLTAPQLLGFEEAVAHAVFGACRVAGDAAPAIAAAARDRGVAVAVVGESRAPSIRCVAMLGSLAPSGDGRPRPFYLKAVDARPMGAPAPAAGG